MKIAKASVILGMFALAMPAMAKPVTAVGTLTSASQGTFIVRNGKLVAARTGQPLFAGDRVITRGKARAKVALKKCSVALLPTSILPVDGGCGDVQSFAGQAQAGGAAAGGAGGGTGGAAAGAAGAAAGGAGVSTGVVVAAGVAAAGAVAGGVVAATASAQ